MGEPAESVRIREYLLQQWQKIAAMHGVVHAALFIYVEPLLRRLAARATRTLVYFDYESGLRSVSSSWTPAEVAEEVGFDFFRDFARFEEFASKHGLSLLAVVRPEPAPQLVDAAAAICPDGDALCVLRNMHRVAVFKCAGRDPGPDVDVSTAITMAEPRCVAEFVAGAKFTAVARIDVLITLMRDLAAVVEDVAWSFLSAEKHRPLLARISARAAEAMDILTALAVKNTGGGFPMSPAAVLGKLRLAYTAISTLIDMVHKALLGRYIRAAAGL